MTRGMDFRKPGLGEYMAPSSLLLCQYLQEVSHCSLDRMEWNSTAQERGCILFLLLRYDGNYNCYDNRSA